MEKNKQNSESMRNAICYIPFFAFIFYFVQKNKTEELEKHIIYWMLLFWVYIIFSIIFSWLIDVLLFLLYIWFSVYFAYIAYIWEDLEVKFIDDFIKKSK